VSAGTSGYLHNFVVSGAKPFLDYAEDVALRQLFPAEGVGQGRQLSAPGQGSGYLFVEPSDSWFCKQLSYWLQRAVVGGREELLQKLPESVIATAREPAVEHGAVVLQLGELALRRVCEAFCEVVRVREGQVLAERQAADGADDCAGGEGVAGEAASGERAAEERLGLAGLPL